MIRSTHVSLVVGAVLLLALAVAGLSPQTAGAASAPATVKVTPATFSPNGDKVKDRVIVRVKLRGKVRLTVAVYGPDGKLVTTLQKTKMFRSGTRTLRWTGRTSGGPLPNGRYQVRVKVKAGKKTTTIKRTATIDTIAPTIDLLNDTEPTLFAGAGHKARLGYRAGERGLLLHLQIRRFTDAKGPTGKVLARAAAGKVRKLNGKVTWNGRGKGRSYLRTGKYALVLLATDKAGNTAASENLALTLFAPTTVRGKVVDREGRPVKGARVIALPARIEGRSGANGAFVLRGVPLGRTVLKAGKRGYRVGGIGASLDLKKRRWTIVLGLGPKGQVVGRTTAAAQRTPGPRTRPSAPATAPRGFWDDVGDAWDDAWDEADSWFDTTTIRMSGSFSYCDKNGDSHPMANIKLVLRDVWFDLVGGEQTRDIVEAETDSQGDFDFTYDITWDDLDTPDVRVFALAEDKWGTEARVETPTFLGDVVCWQGELWNDNESDRLDRFYTNRTGELRGAWGMLDAVRRCHAAGFRRPQILIIYPDSNWPLEDGAGKYQNGGDRIRIFSGHEWGPSFYHEYGHAWLHAAYYVGEDFAGFDANAYDAYLDGPGPDTDGFWLNDWTWYGSKSDGDYANFESEEEPWTAFNEGWAEFFAGFMTGADYAGSTNELFECDRQHAGVDNESVVHSVSRILWDLYDSSSSTILHTWDGTNKPGPRAVPPYGGSDDDRVDGSVGGSDMFAWVKWVLDHKWPSDAWELRTFLREKLAGNARALRAIDAVYYRMGLTNNIIQNRPHVGLGTVLVNPEDPDRDGPYAGTLHLWCRVTDPDSPGGDWDLTRVKVRFEGRCGQSLQTLSSWQPMSFTATRSATPPPGKSGDDWFRVDFDTLQLSPVTVLADHAAGEYTTIGLDRRANTVTGATTSGTMVRPFYQVRAFAFDGLAESDPVESAVFSVNNGNPPMLQYAVAPTYTGNIHWPLTEWEATSTNMTYELWYRPHEYAWGTIIALTWAYPDAPPFSGGRCPVTELGIDDTHKPYFALNQTAADPGTTLEKWITGTTVLQTDTWYHLVAQHGSGGMYLFVNGQLEASDPAYARGGETDEGSPSDPAVSLGQYGHWPANTAMGSYDDVRVSATQRYSGPSFSPPTEPLADDSATVVLDHLDGSTNGVNNGFTFGP